MFSGIDHSETTQYLSIMFGNDGIICFKKKMWKAIALVYCTVVVNFHENILNQPLATHNFNKHK